MDALERPLPVSNPRPATGADLAGIAALADDAFGAGYFAPTGPDGLYVANVGESLAGFAYGTVTSFRELRAGLLKGRPVMLPHAVYVGSEASIGVFKTVVVAPTARRRGVAAQLARAVLAGFGDALLAVSPAWRQPDGEVPARRLLERLGFSLWGSYAEYWLEDSLARGYACSACGNPCRCDMLLYGLTRHTL